MKQITTKDDRCIYIGPISTAREVNSAFECRKAKQKKSLLDTESLAGHSSEMN